MARLINGVHQNSSTNAPYARGSYVTDAEAREVATGLVSGTVTSSLRRLEGAGLGLLRYSLQKAKIGSCRDFAWYEEGRMPSLFLKVSCFIQTIPDR
jgi:hypothetical protein